MSSCFTRKEKKSKRIISNTIESLPTHVNDEVLNNNLIETVLRSILNPLNMIGKWFFCVKYKLKDNRITPNSFLYDVLSFFVTLLLLSICFYVMFRKPLSVDLEGFHYFYYMVDIYEFALYSSGLMLNCFNNIFHKRNNVLLVLKIQHIYSNLKITGNFKRFFISNWLCVIAINCYHVFWVFYYYFAFTIISFDNILTSYLLISIDMNIIYVTRIMKLMVPPLKVWVKGVQSSEYIEDANTESFWNDMFKIYMEIFEAYDLIDKTFNRLVRGKLQRYLF